MELIPLGPGQKALRLAVIGVALLFTLVPVLWVVSVALRPAGLLVFPVPLVPPHVTFENVTALLSPDSGIGLRPYVNAGIYGLSSGLVTALVSLMGGYALTRFDIPFGRILLLVFLALNFLPAAARLIPLFLLYANVGLYDSQVGLILAYVAGATPFGIWLMAGTVSQIPIRLEQAARIDGAGAFTIARRVILPLAMPGVLVVGTLAFVEGWNSFSLPLILMQRQDAQPYTVVLQKYVQTDIGVNWNLLAAGSLVALIPVLVAFAVLQRRLQSSGGFSGAVRG